MSDNDCGCWRVPGQWNTEGDWEEPYIDYCSLHEAAGRMREALEDLVAFASIPFESEALKDAIENAREALAAAGREAL